MTKQPKNVAASVQAQLLALAKRRGDDFQLVLTRYASERFLFRLSASPHASNFVLKGAALFTVWTGHPHRATRDLDFLGYGDSSPKHLRQVFNEVLSISVVDDGVLFDLASLKTAAIREDQEYGGVRLTFVARLGAARVRMQVDVAFGDAVTPSAREVAFPPLLAFPAPVLRAYPRESVVAEKLEALVKLGLANTRMKDFYDLSTMSKRFEFEGALVVQALRVTFSRRGTELPKQTPVALTAAFSEDTSRTAQWTAFAKKSGAPDAGLLGEAMQSVARFCEEPLLAAAGTEDWAGWWKPPGPWSVKT